MIYTEKNWLKYLVIKLEAINVIFYLHRDKNV